jgi:hypothetical protein
MSGLAVTKAYYYDIRAQHHVLALRLPRSRLARRSLREARLFELLFVAEQ